MIVGLIAALSVSMAGLVAVLLWPAPEQAYDAFGTGAQQATGEPWSARFLRVLHVEPDLKGQLARDLPLAEVSMGLSDAYAIRLLSSVIGGVLTLASFLGDLDPLVTALLGILTVAGYRLPDMLITAKAKEARRTLARRLPIFLQSVAIMTEAGLQLFPAIREYVGRDDSVFGRELGRVLVEIEYGMPQSEALLRMAERSGLEEVYAAFSMLAQSLERGAAGVAQAARNLAAEVLQSRRNMARELAEKASTKLFMPLILIVFPVLMFYFLAPAFFNIGKGF